MKLLARVIPVLAGAVVLATLAYLFVPGLRGGDDVDVPGDTEVEWSPRVLPLVEYVEGERGLTFKRPVAVEFLAPREFERAITAEDPESTEEEDREIEEAAGFLRALGLLGADVDLEAETERLTGSGSVGFYSFDDRAIRVRGTELSPRVRATLVHELTHALQDQHFGIVDRFEELRDSEDGSSSAYRALVEGDAERVENAYLADLPPRDRRALEAEQRREGETFRRESAGLPPVLLTLFGAPYALGTAVVGLTEAIDGEGAVDALFEDPPTTEEQLLDPWTISYDAEAGQEVEVATPPVGASEEEVDSGRFGALGWYVVLAARVDPLVALRAADGWGGDAYSAFQREGRTCVRVAYRGDTARDVDELAAALETWIEGSPDAALLQRTGPGLTFASCESDAEVPSGEVDQAVLGLPAARAEVARQVAEGGGPPELARCVGQGAIEEFTFEELQSDDEGLAERATAIALRCTGQG